MQLDRLISAASTIFSCVSLRFRPAPRTQVLPQVLSRGDVNTDISPFQAANRLTG